MKNKLPAKRPDIVIRGSTGADFTVYCERCQRQVDEFRVDTPAVAVEPEPFGYPMMRNSGEIIVTVQCHGARWKISNFRGVLDDSEYKLTGPAAPAR